MKPLRIHPLVLLVGVAIAVALAYSAGSEHAAQSGAKHLTAAALNAAKPLTKPAVDATLGVAEGMTQAAMKPMLAGIEADTNRKLLDIQVLGPRNLVTVADPKCASYVNLVLAASHQAPEDKDRMVGEALDRSYKMGCIRTKSPAELLDPSLRIFYETGRAKFVSSQACTPLLSRVDEIAFSQDTVAHKQAYLAEAFVMAQERGCSRP